MSQSPCVRLSVHPSVCLSVCLSDSYSWTMSDFLHHGSTITAELATQCEQLLSRDELCSTLIDCAVYSALSPVHTSNNGAKTGNHVERVYRKISSFFDKVEIHCVLRGGSAVGRWTCDLQVAGSIPGRWLSRNIGQLSLASLRGR